MPNSIQQQDVEPLVGKFALAYLTNGIKLWGVVTSAKPSIFWLERDDKRQMVFYHAVATLQEANPQDKEILRSATREATSSLKHARNRYGSLSPAPEEDSENQSFPRGYISTPSS